MNNLYVVDFIKFYFFFLDSIWSKLRHGSKPSEKFRENLRADLFEKITKKDEVFFIEYIEKVKIPQSKLVLKIERDWSFSVIFSEFVRSISGLFANMNRSILKIFAFLGTGIAATLLILPLFSVVSVPNSLALEPSVLRSITGDLDIIRSNSVFDPVEYQELYQFDIVKTAENSTSEIVFFDGSVLRLAENTEIKITKIKQHSFLFSTGKIEITLLSGNVWLKTFKDSSLAMHDGLILKTPSFTIAPNTATLSVSYQSGKEWIYAVDNSAIVGVTGVNVDDNIVLKKGEMLNFSIFDEFTPLNEVIPGSFYDASWVANNMTKDISYTSEYLDTVSDKMQEKYIMSTLSTQVDQFLESNPTDEELAVFIADINSLMLALDASHTLEKKEVIEEEPTPIPTANVPKYRPVNNYRPIKKIQKNTNTSETTNTSESFTIEQKVSESVENDKAEGEVVEKKEEKITASQIAEKRRAIQKEEKINSAVHSFSEQIDAFQFENSRKTTALNILDKIPETENNIELLRRIEMNAPSDVKKLVENKRKQIEEKNKTLLNKNTEAVIHNAPLNIKKLTPVEEE